ncbi:hypothetical protein [Paeniglutamicibacter sulfureus]|uniref:hypothetical protein n=1 Tax=Paeniglutamicibacter sulfureus TaxID=43666 RepID=UPI0031CFC062
MNDLVRKASENISTAGQADIDGQIWPIRPKHHQPRGEKPNFMQKKDDRTSLPRDANGLLNFISEGKVQRERNTPPS